VASALEEGLSIGRKEGGREGGREGERKGWVWLYIPLRMVSMSETEREESCLWISRAFVPLYASHRRPLSRRTY